MSLQADRYLNIVVETGMYHPFYFSSNALADSNTKVNKIMALALSKRLGHRNVDITIKTYSHLLKDNASLLSGRFQSIMDEILGTESQY